MKLAEWAEKLKKLLTWRRILVSLSALLIAVGMFFLYRLPEVQQIITRLELITYDFRIQLDVPGLDPHKPADDIVLVVYDNTALYAYRNDYGRWPWPRRVGAEINQFLMDSGAKIIMNDVVYSHFKAEDPEENTKLIETFRHGKPMYIGTFLDNNMQRLKHFNQAPTTAERDYMDPFALQLLNQMGPWNSEANRAFFREVTFDNFEMIVKELFQVGERIVLLNALSDDDGVTRGVPLILRYIDEEPLKSDAPPFLMNRKTGNYQDKKGRWVNEAGYLMDIRDKPASALSLKYFPHMALQLVGEAQAQKFHKPSENALNYVLTRDRHLRFGDYNIPMTENGRMLVRWYHPVEGSLFPYQTVSVSEILEAMAHKKEGFETDSYKRLRKLFHGKTIFVGLTATPHYDVKTSPIQRLVPGVVLQANTYDYLNQGQNFIQHISPFNQNNVNGALCILVVIMIVRFQSAVHSLSSIGLILLGYIAYAIYAFKFHGLWMDIAFPSIAVVFVIILGYVAKYIRRNYDYQMAYHMATTDGLTGLYNHRYFQEHLSQTLELCERRKSKFSLLLTDIDFFKKFNDTYGHRAGDQVLVQVAKKLKKTVRNTDIVARYGGEEMAVILHDCDEDEALSVAQKLVEAIAGEEYLIAEDVRKPVTISVGRATYPLHGLTKPELIEFSDQGLYRAKEGGRNQVGALPEDVVHGAGGEKPVKESMH